MTSDAVIDRIDDGVRTGAKTEFNEAKAMVEVGSVQLNKVSRFLEELPDTARATSLVMPMSTATIRGRGPGTWHDEAFGIGSIDESDGFHHEGNLVKGMPLNDSVEYEEGWAQKVVEARNLANETGKPVLTEVVMGTRQLVNGFNMESFSVELRARGNLLDRIHEVNAALKAQGGEEIVLECGESSGRLFCSNVTQADDKIYPSGQVLSTVGFAHDHTGKRGDFGMSRGFALLIEPDEPSI